MKIDARKATVPDALDRFIQRIGHLISWTNGILVVIIVVQVVLRYGFGHGMVILEELEWHLYGLGFMVGLSYAMVSDSHVRIDLFHRRFSGRTQQWIEILAFLFLLTPFIFLVCWHTIYFVADSWVHNESSMSPMGLPCRWAIKSVIPISFVLLEIAAASRFIRAVIFLREKSHGND